MVDSDPFERARVAQRRTVVRALVLVLLLLSVTGAAIAGVRALHTRRRADAVAIVSGLARTSFAESVDPATGWRRITSAIPAGIVVAAAAIGRDGTFAMAYSRSGDVGDRVLTWRAGATHVAHDTAAQVTALAVSPEGETWIGTMEGGILVMRRDGTVVPSAQRTSGTSISQFAFDEASAKTAVLTSSGEVFTALRGLGGAAVPLRPGVLAPVTLPPHARTRHVIYDDDGDLVLAGDAGAVFVSTSSGWDDRTLAATGDVAAIGLDADGALVVAQSTGHVWRASGVTWDAVGHVPHPPLAIGELPDRGLAVATDDGQLFAVKNESDAALEPGYAATVDEPVFAAQIAGASALFVSVHRTRIWESARSVGDDAHVPGTTWDSASVAVTGVADGCQRVGYTPLLRADDADVVRCGAGRYRVASDGTLAPDSARAPTGGRTARAEPELTDLAQAQPLLAAACASDATAACAALPTASVLPESGGWIADGVWAGAFALLRQGPTTPSPFGDTVGIETVGEIVVRAHVGPPLSAEIVDVPSPLVEAELDGPDVRFVDASGRVVVLRPGVVATIAATGPAHVVTLPAPGLVPTALWRDTGAIALAPHGDLALLADQQSARRILRCHADACVVVAPPPRDDAPMAVGFTADDHLYVITSDHDVAVETR